MKVLVTIVNYGTKNHDYVNALISEYRSMTYSVDIVIISNVAKDFGPDIKVVVGLPTRNPWSLPFNHQRVLSEHKDKYDLFIYSEDDTLITEEHITSFLEVTELLPEDKIAGFMRYELDASYNKTISTIHRGYHWEPDSVKSIGKYTFARFTNDHSACYILTQQQLKKAIASGKYLVSPHEGRYDLICTAATDPYTQCGFKKVICISHIDKFLIHHLPNKYVGKSGIKYDELKKQIQCLMEIKNGKVSKQTLFSTETKFPVVSWDKQFYEPCDEKMLALLPKTTGNVLSVGCGSCGTEAKIYEKGLRVVGIPLDNVMAVLGKAKGIEVVPPDFEEAFALLSKERFDVIILADVLQFLPDPSRLLFEIERLLAKDGHVIIRVPNFNYLGVIKKILLNKELRHLYENNFVNNNIHMTTENMVKGWLKFSELQAIIIEHDISKDYQLYSKMFFDMFRGYLSSRIYIVAGRKVGAH